MARCAAAGRTTAVPTAARGPSLYAVSGVRPVVREVGISNPQTTGVVVGVVRATTTGTQGAGLTEICETDPSKTPSAQAFQTHTADATVGAPIRQIYLAPGSAVIWVWADNGLIIPDGTSNGVVIVTPTGTGQNIDFYFIWDE